MRHRAPAAVLALALAAGPAALLTSGPVAAADDTTQDCSQYAAGSGEQQQPPSSDADSKPLQEMDVADAQQFLTTRAGQAQPGQGVTVAVLDSGVTPGVGINVVGTVQAGALLPQPAFYHGTDVAGLIAGASRADGKPVGVAPGAGIFDVRVYDTPDSSDPTQAAPITSDNVVNGLQQVLANVKTHDIKVVTIALEVPADPRIADLIDQLWKAGVVTVAASGNRPQQGSVGPLPSNAVSPSAGEDFAGSVFPAAYDHVLAVGSSMSGVTGDDPPQAYLLQNSDTRIAAPTALGVSYSVVGGACVNTVPATSWAAAYVSGVLALDQSYYHESPARAVSRLIETASGRPDIPNELTGAGEVQPLAALTRPLQMTKDGKVLNTPVAQTEPQIVRAPTTPPDVLASTRRNAVWWGLAGGGALLVALLLRPVLARRRPDARQPRGLDR